MKVIWLCFFYCFFYISLFGQTFSLCSWNLKDFGQTKSDEEIAFIARTVKDFDILAIQEVVAGYGGAQAVARLVDMLNRSGQKWDYSISDPTSSSSYKAERYAFIWKTSRFKRVSKPWLERKYNVEIDREPYFIELEIEGKKIVVCNFHAITKAKQPEREIKYFKFLPEEYSGKNLLFCGDFNCPEDNSVFLPLKSQGYTAALVKQKTTLKRNCIAKECLSSEFDNIFYKQNHLLLIGKGIVEFYVNLSSMQKANEISDHVPVFASFRIK